MNTKFSQFLNLSRNYHHNHRFSLNTWRFFLDKLKQEFPNSSNRSESFRRLQNGFKIAVSFFGRECSPIVAQRAFRGYRILQLHSRLWSYNSSNPMSKKALLSFVIFSMCQAKDKTSKKEIEDKELATHMKDLDYIRELTAATVVCPLCKDRLTIDKRIPGIKYCSCEGQPQSVFNREVEGYPWVPFAETPDLLIWRQPHPTLDGLFIYKVYGYYNDISAQDFLEAQLDMEYRKQWDDTALELQIVEKDPKSHSEIVYWEMLWPRMFANRDYVFARRHKVYRNDMVIMSKAVTHPLVPEKSGVHRVKEYSSVMHIRGAKGLSHTGVEFGLTYFDNPGLSLPQWLISWAAITGIPEFLDKQRNAARVRRLFGKPPEKFSRRAVGSHQSQSNYSDTKWKQSPPPPSSLVPSQSPEKTTEHIAIENSSVTSNKCSSNNTGSINSDNSSSTSNPTLTTASCSPQQHQEGKNELLSQFFKEQILDVHS